jgi:ribonucleoside-diphosphate reductase alpha chain
MQIASPTELAQPSESSGIGLEKSNDRPPVVAEAEQRDLFARAQRRKLPDERKSITHRFAIGGHEGYIIVGMYAEGAPGEIFIKMAKEGSTLSGFMDGVALSISIGLQYGVPLKAIVDKLTNTRFEPSGFTENPSIRYASSVLDYIARWLGGKFLSSEYLKSRTTLGEHEVVQPPISAQTGNTAPPWSVGPSSGSGTTGDAPSCPNCGMLMVPNGSCYKCVNCGSTSGCS